MDKKEEGNTTEERGEFGGKKGLSGKWKERAFVVETTGVTACMGADRSSIGHWKGQPP